MVNVDGFAENGAFMDTDAYSIFKGQARWYGNGSHKSSLFSKTDSDAERPM